MGYPPSLSLSLSPFFSLYSLTTFPVPGGTGRFTFFLFFLFLAKRKTNQHTHTYSRNVYKVEGGEKEKKKKRRKVLLLLGFFYYSVQTGVIKKRWLDDLERSSPLAGRRIPHFLRRVTRLSYCCKCYNARGYVGKKCPGQKILGPMRKHQEREKKGVSVRLPIKTQDGQSTVKE